VKLEEYRKRLIELESLPWNESYRKIAEADKLSIYLGKPSPMRSTAIKFIFDARQRGELPNLDASVRLESCKLLDPYDEKSPESGGGVVGFTNWW
jgi:hypothetical protein